MTEAIPLLEFDDERGTVLEPSESVFQREGTLPERVVLCFYAEILEALSVEAVQIGALGAAYGTHPVWRLPRHGVDVAVFHPGVGAPLAAAFLEEAIAMGATKVVTCGGSAIVTTTVSPGTLIVPTSAVRDEGTSYHYLPASREITADPLGVEVAEAVLLEHGVAYKAGKVWTTDALYRETHARVARRQAEGCLVVEMEASALIAVARFRHVRLAQLLYAGDDVSGESWDKREWTTSPSRQVTFDLAVEIAARL